MAVNADAKTTAQELADALDARGVPTPSGRGTRWQPAQVGRVMGRYTRPRVAHAASLKDLA